VPQTIKSYLSVVHNTLLSLGFPDLRKKSSLPALKQVQVGIQRVRAMNLTSLRHLDNTDFLQRDML